MTFVILGFSFFFFLNSISSERNGQQRVKHRCFQQQRFEDAEKNSITESDRNQKCQCQKTSDKPAGGRRRHSEVADNQAQGSEQSEKSSVSSHGADLTSEGVAGQEVESDGQRLACFLLQNLRNPSGH